MQAIAIQQQMLSSFPPVAPAPQSPPSQHYSHTSSPKVKFQVQHAPPLLRTWSDPV
ncbi:hypothetical protein PAMP_009444 [Pampus punctatissimus]